MSTPSLTAVPPGLHLIVEASSSAGSMALIAGGVASDDAAPPLNAQHVAHVAIPMGSGRDDLLTPALVPLLEHAGHTMRDLAGLVCGAGPGSFTSLRIAAAFAKGLAFGLDIPLYAMTSLVLVSDRDDHMLSPGAYCIVADALREECYAQCVDVDAHGHAMITAEPVRVHTRDVASYAGERMVVRADANTAMHPRATMARWIAPWSAFGPVNVDAWEPAYGRLAEAQVKWEAAHGRALG